MRVSSELRLEYDPSVDTIRIPVTIEIEPDRIAMPAALLQQKPIEETNRIFERLVTEGLRARIAGGNLLLGQHLIELDFVPNAPPARLVRAKPYPELPTVAEGGFEDIANSAGRFLDKVSALPLDRLVGEIRNMVTHADGVIASPDAETLAARAGSDALQYRAPDPRRSDPGGSAVCEYQLRGRPAQGDNCSPRQ